MDSAARTVTLADLVRFHGHPCDGLVAASAAIAYGLGVLFPEGVVDRTDVTAAVNASPCYGDAAAYLTGARARYHTLVIDERLGDTWILHRRSTGRTVAVSLKAGVKPKELPGLEKELRSEGCDSPLIRRVQELQSGYAKAVLASPPSRIFDIKPLLSFPYEVGPIRADATKARCRP
jgi:formylmethanofuran dehydrogenase subunit E